MEMEFEVSPSEFRSKLAASIDAPDFRGWPRKPIVGAVGDHTFVLMKRRRSVLDLFYLACQGTLVARPAGVSVSLAFVRSPVAPLLEYAWLPVATVVLLGTCVIVVAQALSGEFSPLSLLAPIMVAVMLAVGVGLRHGLRSSNELERSEILSYLGALGGETRRERITG